jgi:hypothetical protein
MATLSGERTHYIRPSGMTLARIAGSTVTSVFATASLVRIRTERASGLAGLR